MVALGYIFDDVEITWDRCWIRGFTGSPRCAGRRQRSAEEVLNSFFLANGLLLCSFIVTPLALAHLPELYGRQYIRIVEPEDKADADSEVSPLAVPSKRDQLQHDKSLAEAEMAGGPYGAGLVDPLINSPRPSGLIGIIN